MIDNFWPGFVFGAIAAGGPIGVLALWLRFELAEARSTVDRLLSVDLETAHSKAERDTVMAMKHEYEATLAATKGETK